ncbi:hypothetical protein C3F00_031455 [Pseudomonas sp. MWU13-2860]|nr:hypothetical protein C3F00_031455 [Pseudomonas sp. MWU13-2860]
MGAGCCRGGLEPCIAHTAVIAGKPAPTRARHDNVPEVEHRPVGAGLPAMRPASLAAPEPASSRASPAPTVWCRTQDR